VANALSDADCVHPYCGWTGLVKECSTILDEPRCPECGGEVKVFDAPNPTGVSEFAVISCRDCGAAHGEHRPACPQIDSADYGSRPPQPEEQP
jgi:hypothetical protein